MALCATQSWPGAAVAVLGVGNNARWLRRLAQKKGWEGRSSFTFLEDVTSDEELNNLNWSQFCKERKLPLNQSVLLCITPNGGEPEPIKTKYNKLFLALEQAGANVVVLLQSLALSKAELLRRRQWHVEHENISEDKLLCCGQELLKTFASPESVAIRMLSDAFLAELAWATHVEEREVETTSEATQRPSVSHKAYRQKIRKGAKNRGGWLPIVVAVAVFGLALLFLQTNPNTQVNDTTKPQLLEQLITNCFNEIEAVKKYVERLEQERTACFVDNENLKMNNEECRNKSEELHKEREQMAAELRRTQQEKEKLQAALDFIGQTDCTVVERANQDEAKRSSVCSSTKNQEVIWVKKEKDKNLSSTPKHKHSQSKKKNKH
jgi:hypothetical protein